MSRPMKILAIVVGVLLLLVVGSWLALQALLSDSTKQKVLARLSTAVGVPVKVGDISIAFGELLKLQPALSLTNVSVGNPAGFKSPQLLQADAFHGTVDLRSLVSGNPDVRNVRLIHPVMTVERNAQGITNLQVFLKNLTEKPAGSAANGAAPGKGGETKVSISEFVVTNGELHLIGIPSAGGNDVTLLRNVEYRLDGFATGKPLHNKLEAGIYEGKVSRLSFDGAIGPVAGTAMPLNGKMNLKLGVTEVPAPLLAQFGTLLKSPGADSTVDLATTLTGDLYGRATGPIELTLSNIRVGPDPKRTLPLSGKTTGTIAISNLLSTASYAIQLPDAQMQFGKGQLKAQTDFAAAGTLMEGSAKGSISGIDIAEFLAVFSPGGLKVSGLLSVPRFAAKFEGDGPDAVMASLVADGSMAIGKGRIDGLDLITSIKNAADNPTAALSGAAGGGKGATEFADLKTNFAIAKQTLRLSDIALDATAARIRGNGTITASQAINMQLEAYVTGSLAKLLGKDPSSEAVVPVTVSGTVSNPSVRPQVKRMMIDTGLNYLDKFLGGKSRKK